MRKIFLILLVLFALSENCLAVEYPSGFKGYPWGTDFWTINNEKILLWHSTTNNDEGVHFSTVDSSENKEYRYIFLR